MKKTFKIGILITPENVYLGLVENKFISLAEKKYKYTDFDFINIDKEIEKFLNEIGLRPGDIDSINLVDEVNSEISNSIKIESIKLNKLTKADWILNSNWIYSLNEIESENISEYNPVYPYLTVYSAATSTDLILNESQADSKIIGSFSDQTPELLIKEIAEILEIKIEDIDDLTSIGDPVILNFEYELAPDLDLRISSIKEPLEKEYKNKLAEYSAFEEKLKVELIKNLKADLAAAAHEKLFDYINTKLFGIADAMQVKVISLVGDFWLNKRFQEKLIRVAVGTDIKIKFPAETTPLPLGSFVANN